MNVRAQAIASIGIRGVSMLARAGFVFYLARAMSTSEFGIFGVIQSSLAIGLYLVGLDVYVVTTRDIPKLDRDRQKAVVFQQGIVHGVAYCSVLPLYVALLAGPFLPRQYALGFAGLLVFEHLSFEIVRILTALKYPVQANLLVLGRGVLWIVPFVVVTVARPELMSLELLIRIWSLGVAISAGVGLFLLYQHDVLPSVTTKVRWRDVRGMLSGALLFLIASVSNRILAFSGRYALALIDDDPMVGVFTLYQNFVMLVEVFVYTGVVMILLPHVITARESGDSRRLEASMLSLQAGLWWGTIIPCLFLAALGPFALALFGKGEMVDSIGAFWVMLLVAVVVAWGQMSYYRLYVAHRDRAIVLAGVLGLAAGIACHLYLTPKYALMGAVASTGVGLCIAAVSQFLAAGGFRTFDWEPMRVRCLVRLARPGAPV